jgi:glucose/arabinose dehydrogenase
MSARDNVVLVTGASRGIGRAAARLFAVAAGLAVFVAMNVGAEARACESEVFDSERERFCVRTLVRGLEHPWSIAFLPGGDMLITERPGRLLRVDGESLQPSPVVGLPSIAASGMTLYSGDKFPGWRGNLFVGALKYRLLVRLEVGTENSIHEERLLEDVLGRIRDVRTGPDGYIYILTDRGDGVLARLEPA